MNDLADRAAGAGQPASTADALRRRSVEPALLPFEGRWYDVPGGRMHALVEGEGPDLVIVHGNPTWCFAFRRWVELLRPHFRVIVPDHIGCGLSERADPANYGYRLEDRVADLTALLEQLDVQRTRLLVHDWGGMIGLSWAVEHVDAVERVTACNTAGFGLPAAGRVPLSLRLARVPALGAALVRGLGLFERVAARRCVTTPLEPAVRRAYTAPYASWRDRLAVHRFVLDIPLDPSHPSWQRVQRTAQKLATFEDRLLVCWGRRDFVFDDHFLDEWRSRLPDAIYRTYDEAGHYVFEDRFEVMRDPVLRHLLGEEVSSAAER